MSVMFSIMNEEYEGKANEEFEDDLELYRKETKTNARKATIVTTIFIALFFILLQSPYQKFKDYRSLKNLNKPITEYFQSGKKKYESKFNDNHFVTTEWYENGQKKSQDISYREYIVETRWYKNGQKESEAKFDKDINPIGLSSEWHENGNKRWQGNFKKGKPDGLFVEWHQNGNKFTEYNYNEGEIISSSFWNSKGKPVDSKEEAKAE